MTLILSIWTVSLIVVALIYIAAVRGINILLLLAAIVDAFKDIACQIYLDVSKIWKRRKEIELDEYERFYND